jgi:NAD(P)-dependent dehydrogenase (short-subunit alcohol dehydrogenase family)
MLNLEGKVALVTGAARKMGIGRAIALRLAREGADVAINGVSLLGAHRTDADTVEDWQGIKSVAAEIRALGRKALAVEADISSTQQVQAMVDKCIAEFGKIDILVNNAAINGSPDTPGFEEDMRQVVDVNLLGTYWVTKAVGLKMIERGKGGKIINIATEGVLGRVVVNPPGLEKPKGPVGWRGGNGYLVSKFGVVGLTVTLAAQLAAHKINVNAVCPGMTATRMLIRDDSKVRGEIRSGTSLEAAASKALEDLVPLVPMGHIGLPEDIAKVVAFLSSEYSDFMTGQVMGVTGGHDIMF